MTIHNIRPINGYPNIPTLGEPCKVHGWWPTMMVACTCTPAPITMALIGFGAIAMCPVCRQRFTIKRAMGDGETGQNQAVVAALGKLPEEPTQ